MDNFLKTIKIGIVWIAGAFLVNQIIKAAVVTQVQTNLPALSVLVIPVLAAMVFATCFITND